MNKEERIRNRKSYKNFAEFLDWLNSEDFAVRTVNDNWLPLLENIHKMIDDMRGFHTESKSAYALESIKQLAKDRGM